MEQSSGYSDRVFIISPEHEITAKASQIVCDILDSGPSDLGMRGAANLLYDAASLDAQYSRTVALVAEEVFLQLQRIDPELGDVFVHRLETVTINVFIHCWLAFFDPEGLKDLLGVSIAPRPTQTEAQCACTFLGDLYAVGLITPELLRECVKLVVREFTEAQHLTCLLILFCRANSYMGPRMRCSFYLESLFDIRKRCMDRFDFIDTTPEESMITDFIRQLLMDEADQIDEVKPSQFCEIPFQHLVNKNLFCEAIFDAVEPDQEPKTPTRSAALGSPKFPVLHSPQPTKAFQMNALLEHQEVSP